MRQWQVEYITRPDEIERIEILNDFRAAHQLARDMSDKHDCDAVVIALDDLPDGGKVANGHMEYVFGTRQGRYGCLANTAWPKL